MFNSLFKSGWQSKSADKRLHFVENAEESVDANQSIFEKLATTDNDDSVRFAAMAKMSNPQALFDLSQSHDKAIDYLRNLLKSDVLSAAQCQQFADKNVSATPLVAAFSQHADVRHSLLKSMPEREQAKSLVDVAFSNTRVNIAENLKSIEALDIARKLLKGKDKNAEKIIKAKIDAIHAQQKQEEENDALVKDIREKMQALARYIHWSDEIRVKYFSLSKQWDGLDFEPKESEKALYETAFTNVTAEVKNNMAIALSAQNQSEVIKSLNTLVRVTASFSLETALSESVKLNEELNALIQQWCNETEKTPANENNQSHYEKLTQTIRSMLNLMQSVKDTRALDDESESADVKNHHAKAILQACKNLRCSNENQVVTCKEEAVTEAQAILKANKEALKQAKKSLDELHKRISRLFGIAKRGEINRANRELNAIINASEKYQGFERKKLEDRIEEVTTTVNNMGDWKDFALEPKLVELCGKMEKLAAKESPDVNQQAKHIKELQTQWKSLGSSDVSDSYWERFKAAGDKAYEPCSLFFKQRRDTQKENLQKRDPYINEMKALLENTTWDSKTDYKTVEGQLSRIMQSWKKIKDVDHSRGQKQWEKLVAYKDQVDEKLDAEYDKNIKAKQALITVMEQLKTQEVTDKTLDTLKFQQSKWKQIGVTRRKQDQAAWIKFKTESDAVYDNIQGLRKEKRAAEDEEINAFKEIHKQIHHLAKTTTDIAVSDKTFEDLETQYKGLPALPQHLPEKLSEKIQQDYRRACDSYAKAKDRLNLYKIDQELETLAQKAALCTQLEQAKESDIKTLEAKIEALEITNKDHIKRFKQRLSQARNTDREAFTQDRRLVLINAEILLGIDSPKEDKELRLKIQLERMTQDGIGHSVMSESDALTTLKLNWLCLPGAEAKAQKAFDKRFEGLLSK